MPNRISRFERRCRSPAGAWGAMSCSSEVNVRARAHTHTAGQVGAGCQKTNMQLMRGPETTGNLRDLCH